MKINRVKHFLITVLLIISASQSLTGAENITVAVFDFSVRAEKAAHRLTGKAFPELIIMHLKSIEDITPVNRKTRNTILADYGMGTATLSDTKERIRAGKALSAAYIVTGKILVSGKTMTVAFSIIDTENGAYIMQEQIKGPVTSYNSLSADITKKILTALKRRAPGSINDIIKESPEGSEEALIAFSDAVDAFDCGDMESAIINLEKARKYDPENRAIKKYTGDINKTATFRTIREHYLPGINPSYLGFIDRDELSVTLSYAPLDGIYDIDRSWKTTADGSREFYEEDRFARISYFFPVFDKTGLGVEGFYGESYNTVRAKTGSTLAYEAARCYYMDVTDTVSGLSENSLDKTYTGGIFSIGTTVGSNTGIGGSISIYDLENEYSGSRLDKTTVKAVTAGLLYKKRNADLIFDTIIGYATEKMYLIDTAIASQTYNSANCTNYYVYPVGGRIKAPKYNENTVTAGFFNRQLFLIGKEINYIYSDLDYVIRFIPAVEYRVSDYITANVSADISRQKIADSNDTKIGGGFGFTITDREQEVELDASFIYREDPCRFLEGESSDRYLTEIRFTRRNLFFER